MPPSSAPAHHRACRLRMAPLRVTASEAHSARIQAGLPVGTARVQTYFYEPAP